MDTKERVNKFQSEINEAFQEKENELKRDIEESKFDNNICELADLIHGKFCKDNHVDECGWFYESWSNPGWEREKYVKKVQNLLNLGFTKQEIINFIKCI